MRILVVSDNHGHLRNLERALEREAPIDLLIHLGDSGVEADTIEDLADCPVEMVAGNCDYYSELPKVKTVSLPGHVAFLTHGHLYDVRYGAANLDYAAREAGADLAFFGHTHIPLIDYYEDMTFLNPGSLEQPRQADCRCSYATVTIDTGKRVHCEIKYLD